MDRLKTVVFQGFSTCEKKNPLLFWESFHLVCQVSFKSEAGSLALLPGLTTEDTSVTLLIHADKNRCATSSLMTSTNSQNSYS